jgi:muconolactone delta-isomerase
MCLVNGRRPPIYKIELFVVRVGDWGGHMLVECDDPLTVHKLCSTFPAFEFEARPVVPVEDAVRVELEAIAWRDGLKGK